MDKISERIKNFITAPDEDDLTGEMDTVESVSEYEKPTKKGIAKTEAKMIIFEPRSYEEATEIADYLKAHKACVVNIHRLQNEYRQRLIDFLWGAVYAIDGKIQKVGQDVFLCTPANVPVNGQVEDTFEQ